jgi:hypothetical protein
MKHKKMHWLQDRVLFVALVKGETEDEDNYVDVAEYPFNNEAELARLAQRHPGLSYVVQTRHLFDPQQ